MKRCSKCGQTKTPAEFGINNGRSDGLQSQCRPCRKETNHNYYMANPMRARRQLAADRVREENRKIVYGVLSAGVCVDCGLSDWRVLEFDHVSGDKVADVSSLLYCSTKKLLEEIAKCEIRCKNCHTLITYARAGSWRMTYPNSSEEEHSTLNGGVEIS